MTLWRGEIVLAPYPFASGTGAKKRPVLIVQNDRDNQRLTNTIVAQITSNTRRRNELTHLLIQVASPEGQQSGLLTDSVISCINLATVEQALLDRRIGSLHHSVMAQVNECIRVALGLP